MKKIFKEDESEKLVFSDSQPVKDSFLNSVFNNNPAIMLLLDPDNKQKILEANDSALKFYGYTREEILKLDMGAINTKSLAERNNLMKKAINLPNSYYQFQHRTSSGTLKTVEVNASPVEYNNKKVMFIIVHDISELKRSNEQFELAMAGSNLGLWDFWVQSGVLHINDRWAEMLGYSVEELSPLSFDTWKELTHVEDYQKASQLIERCYIKEINKYECPIRMKHKDGSWIWIQDRGKVFEWDEEGNPIRMSGTHLDITERKKIEIKLAESEERLGLAVAGSEIGIWDWHIQTGESYYDEMWAKIIGYTLEELSPVSIDTWIDKVHPDDLKKYNIQIEKCFNKEIETHKSELRMKHKDGSWVWILSRGKVVEWSKDGKPVRSSGTHLDITERKLTEQKLKKTEERFRSYFESSPYALMEEDFSEVYSYIHQMPFSDKQDLRKYLDIHPEAGKKCVELVKILDVNPAALNMFEARSKEDLFWNLNSIFTKGAYDIFKEELICFYDNEELFTAESAGRTLKGKHIKSKIEIAALSDDRVLATITDITDLKNKELKLEELLAQTKADSETKEILLREINHRVKNHLSSFIGMLYAEKKQSGSNPNAFQMEHVDNLINRVKGISIAHEMLSRSQWAPISINILAEKIMHSLNPLIPKDRIIDVKLYPSEIFLDADQSHSTAILINELFSNSIEHASHPGEKIKVEIKIKEKKGTIFLLYRDSGPGYPDEILESEFKNVGMYLIKNIVEQSLRGVFQISNKNGAKIEIKFPGAASLKNYNSESKNLKILIAEDDFLVSEMIEGELTNAGYEVIGKAANGQTALELTQTLKPDLVLMDIRMPELNGLEASRKIMEICPTPVIILTAYDNRDMVVDAGDAGVAAYLNKPLDSQELERAILISMARFKDIMELREKNKELDNANTLNISLMKEIHHRVKNNFQLISSLLNLQIGSINDNKLKHILEAGRDRVQTLAILHEKLYESGDLVSLPMNVFVEDLLKTLLAAYNTKENTFYLDLNIESIVLDSKKAVSTGLILNEAVTNSIKYAFTNHTKNKALISVSMIVENQNILLKIKDNGIGVTDIEKTKSGDTLGLQLIYLLTESQLEGSIEVISKEGLEIRIRFKP